MTEQTTKRKNPVYHGMRKFADIEGGYGVWLSSEWFFHEMTNGHRGAIFTPYEEDLNTCFACEKVVLKYKTTQEDAQILREGFEEGVLSLPGVEVEKFDQSVTNTLMIFDAIFSFDEEGQRRKRWVRNVYWGEGQLILLAQGTTPEEFEYWRPMFFNTMLTAEVGQV